MKYHQNTVLELSLFTAYSQQISFCVIAISRIDLIACATDETFAKRKHRVLE